MDTALIIITLLSVGLTGALLVYATRLQREHREREDARVLALAREIEEPETFGSPTRRTESPIFGRDESRGDTAAAPWPSLETVAYRPVRSEGDDAAADVAVGSPLTAASSMFAVADDAAPTRSRLLAPVIGVGVVGLVLVGVYATSARPAASAESTRPAVTAPAASPALELVSLDQVRAGRTLTVRGVVRNPAGASPARGLAAVVFVFDKSGAFVTSARSPLDYQELAPGDESPFTVTVPNAARVARYRVSFRNDRDVVSHVDRRKHERAEG